jgi:hypothetical protein
MPFVISDALCSLARRNLITDKTHYLRSIRFIEFLSRRLRCQSDNVPTAFLGYLRYMIGRGLSA